jgi:hypothetical protein
MQAVEAVVVLGQFHPAAQPELVAAALEQLLVTQQVAMEPQTLVVEGAEEIILHKVLPLTKAVLAAPA